MKPTTTISSHYRDIVSGQRRGFCAAGERLSLAAVEPFYASAIWWRNRQYDRGHWPITRLPIPVVSVGNLTLGGTGKTPFVRWLARWFIQQGIHVALVSRGYGAKSGEVNDEALELSEQLPGIPHFQDRDRVAAASRAIAAQDDCRLIILDDGFQHRRLARDLDIVLLDALEPFGFGRLFPRGTLREPIESLQRADIIALSRADAVTATERQAIHDQVRVHAPHAHWCELEQRPGQLVRPDGATAPLSTLRGLPIAAFCGIGNPQGFQHTLQVCEYGVAAFREYPDHHHYTPADIEGLKTWCREMPQLAAIVCTRKDLVKLKGMSFDPLPLYAVEIETRVPAGADRLQEHLRRLSTAKSV